jgi:type IV secretory pathway VirB2 component (pilin)
MDFHSIFSTTFGGGLGLQVQGADQIVLHALYLASYGPTSGSLVDPPGSSVVVAAVVWLQGTLLGTVATVIAIIAVSSVGLMMFSGRVNIRYGLTVILGCFILFGASTIVAGIQSTLSGAGRVATSTSRESPPPMVAPPPAPPPPANNDPYAGASVPAR